jgi:ketosteroid isomerase-like protein
VIKAISANDIAMLYTDFQGTAMDPSEKTIDVRYKAIEVLRQESDGYWTLIVGNPSGRE